MSIRNFLALLIILKVFVAHRNCSIEMRHVVIFCYLRFLGSDVQIGSNCNNTATKMSEINVVIHFDDIGSQRETFRNFHFSSFFDLIRRQNELSCQHQATLLRSSEKKRMFFDKNNETPVSQFCSYVHIFYENLRSKTVLYTITLKRPK